MKKTQRFISFLLVVQIMLLCMLIPGITATDVVTETPIENENVETVLAMPEDTETEISVEEFVQDELMPMAAQRCSTAPPMAYAAYDLIVNNNGADFYKHHAYDNISAPYLPIGTTYITYYLMLFF